MTGIEYAITRDDAIITSYRSARVTGSVVTARSAERVAVFFWGGSGAGSKGVSRVDCNPGRGGW